MTLKTAIIGLGKQMIEDHLPAAMESDNFEVSAVCDVDTKKVSAASEKYHLEGFTDIDKMIKKIDLDVAIVAVPHDQYSLIIPRLAKKKIHIIKEKPFAVNREEALSFHQLAKENDILLGVTLQRRFNPIFQSFDQLKRRIGKIYAIEGRYVMNIAKLDDGWRSSRESAGGGVLIDMGYHFIDLLVWYMGLPNSITARLSRGNRPDQRYDVEDTANILFDYCHGKSEEKIVGNIILSRVYPKKDERLTFVGTKGIINIKRGIIQRLDTNGEEIERLERNGSWPSAATDQLDFFARAISNRQIYDHREHFKHVAIIEAAYESDKRSTSCNPIDYLIN